MSKTARLIVIVLVGSIIFESPALAGSILGLSGNLAFSLVTVNTTKTTTLTISNTGTSTLTVNGISYPDGFTGNWSSGAIAAGGSQNVTVTFSPTAVQAYSGTVTVASDMTSGTNSATISGSGTAVPSRIIALLGNMTFGNVTVNSTKASTLTISNAGNSVLSVGGVTLPSGFALGANYQGSNNSYFPHSIAANSAANVTVLFRPTAVQAYVGNVTVYSDMNYGTNTASISAIGTPEPAPDGNFRYSDNGETITVTGFVNSPVGGLVIPSLISGKSITSIGDSAFQSCSGLTSVTIPSSVTSIGSYAFYGCSGLTSVTIPSSVTSIGSYAFYGCSEITSVSIPPSVTSIGSSAFQSCSKLTLISVDVANPNYSSTAGVLFDKLQTTLIQCPSGIVGAYAPPPNITRILDYAFQSCSGLTSVTIPSNVLSIGSSAFYGCSGLSSVTIPSGVTSIEDFAFYGCSGLVSVTIPSGVTNIGSSTFSGCSGLTSVTIPSGVTNIGFATFNGCSGLTSMTIPSGITTIGSSAFYGCSGLTSVSIPSGVISIGSSAFYGCSGLTSITIPSGVISIEGWAFEGCSGLTSVTIPSTVTSIGIYAFQSCSGLTSMTIPTSVTTIGEGAFRSCSGLTSVTIPSSVTSIGNRAFDGCNKLTSVTIPSSVTSIGSYAFISCSRLTSVTIPSGVTTIGGGAFYGCSRLTNAQFDGNAPAMGSSVFGGNASGFTVKYHTGAVGFTSPTWNGYPAIDIGPLPTRIIGVSGNLTFGSVTVNSTAANTLMIGNSGNLPLTVTSITYPTGFSGNWLGGSIAAGLTQNVTVTFSPSAVQTYSGTVSVSSDSTSGTGVIPASGQGVAPPTPFSTWQGNMFTATDILAGQTTMAADFDNDGMPNLLEYAFGTNPKTPNPLPLTVSFSGNNVHISFPCNASCTDINYTVQSSSDLFTWKDVAKSTGGEKTQPISNLSAVSDAGTGARTVWVTDSSAIPAGGKRFLRLNVVSSPQ